MNASSAMHVVTGGAGFIGRHFVETLAGRGDRVRVLDRRAPTWELPAGTEFRRVDVAEPMDPALFEGATVVYHLAGLPKYPGYPLPEYERANAETTRRVLAAMAEAGCATLVFTSTMRVYDLREEPVDESVPPDPKDPYGVAKLRAEEMVREWQAAAPGRRAVVTRPAVIFGPGERANYSRLIRALRRGRFVYPGRRDTVKSCGYVKDLVASTDHALGLDRPFFLYNFAYPDAVTLERVVEGICRTAGLKAPRLLVPSWVILGACVAATVLTAGRSVLHPRLVGKLLHSSWLVPKALMDSGFRFPTTFESALEDWYRTDGFATE